jgi:hypothetical protein
MNGDVKPFTKFSKSHSSQSIKGSPTKKSGTKPKKANIFKHCLKINGSCQRMINHFASSYSKEYTVGVSKVNTNKKNYSIFTPLNINGPIFCDIIEYPCPIVFWGLPHQDPPHLKFNIFT